MAPLIPVMAAMKAKEAGASAIKNDIAVIRWTKPATSIGKGKHKRIKPAKDIELHVNPTSLAVGAGVTVLAIGGAAIAAGIGLYASGLHVERTDNKTTTRTLRIEMKDGRPVRSVLQTNRGIPIRYFDGPTSWNTNNFLSSKELEMGWKVTGLTSNPANTVVVASITKGNKQGYQIAQREKFSLGDLAPKLF